MNKLIPKLSLKIIVRNIAVIAGSLAIIGAIAFKLYQRIIYPDSFITDVDWYKPLATIKGKPSTLPVDTSSSIPQESLNKISTYAQENNSYALLVLHKGKIVLERYWEGFTSTSTSNSMSMSKTIVALLIGIAIEEGHIDSELDPVAKYIPEWSQDERKKITLQDLLYMQSGLQNNGHKIDPVVFNVPAIKPPKEAFDYNNVNTQILTEVLTRATGKKYVDYLSTRLWQPLQANDAAILLDRDRPQENPKTFCCLFATPHDWGKVGQLFIDRGKVNNKQVVPSAWLDKMVQPSSIEDSYGYHIWLKAKTREQSGIERQDSQPFVPEDIIYLDGKYFQRVYIIPAHDLVIVRIGEEADDWDDVFIPNTLVSGLSFLAEDPHVPWRDECQ